jgi:hypothetical protein
VPERELTRDERAGIRKLVTSLCAYYDYEYGCLPLDCPCYMLHKWWTGALCKYYRCAVLPVDPVLEASLTGQSILSYYKSCEICGKLFVGDGRQRYCSPKCANTARKRAEAQRAKKYRQNKGSSVTGMPPQSRYI